MKKLYLVRHGESTLNAKQVHQDGTAELSKKGIEQAKLLAERLVTIPIDSILASPFERAKLTANIISQRLHILVEFNQLLVELKRPTEIEGRQIFDPDVIALKNKISENWHNPDFRYSDEETFYDFKIRAGKVIELLTQIKKEHILVVTHGNFIRMIICLILFGGDTEPNTLIKLRNNLSLSNTGITVCTLENEQWKLITLNDVAHIPA